MHLQSTLVISKSKGPAETLRDIHSSTYQMCRIEEKNQTNNQISQMNMLFDSFKKKFMLKILRKRGKIAPVEQFLPLSTIFYYLMLDFYVKTGIRFSLRDKRLFERTEVEITRVDCIYLFVFSYMWLLLMRNPTVRHHT